MSSTLNAQSSSTTSSTTLRPRAKRLISGLSEGDETAPETFDSLPRRINSPAPSPFDSRSASPIPAAHPQRTGRSSNDGAQRFMGNSWGRRAQVSQRKTGTSGDGSPLSPASLVGLWSSSWTTLQGLASDFLGNDLSSTISPGGSPKLKPQKSPLKKLHARQFSSAEGPSEWGPSAPTSQPITTAIGSGTRSERESALRAQKRKDMLMRQDSSYADALGKFKRRLSDDHESISAPPGENDDRAALVYLHEVKKDDTLAGITIKYNCSANAVRKANRMWPNDTVQSRQTLVLPVDACGVKGKPVSGPNSDLMESPDAFEAEEVPTPTAAQPQPQAAALVTNGNSDIRAERSRTTSISTTSRSIDGSSGEPPWHHDSWVLLPGSTQPTEIARLSRRALGYFPPARRKSGNFSDLDTPSTSLDLNRPSISAAVESSGDTAGARSSSQQRPRRQRKLSNAGNGYFPSYLAGPGGVGSMGKNVHYPGPAQDGLNKFFARHLPDVAPPKNQTDLYQPDLPMYSDETPTPSAGGSGYVTPSLLPGVNQNYPSSGGGINLENVGGAIEGWVRRLASKTTTPSSEQTPRQPKGRGRQFGPRTSVGAPGRGSGGVGDLIEMTDEFELGAESDEDEYADRGRQGSVIYLGHEGGGGSSNGAGVGGSGADYTGGGASVKGRTRTVSAKKSGKDD